MAKRKTSNKSKVPLKYEELVQLCLVDLLNGYSRNDIMQKLNNDLYEGHKSSEFCRSTKYYILQECYERCKMELAENMDKMRELFYNRLLAVYNESLLANDRQNALKSLDMVARFAGLYDKEKVELSGNLTENVNISFGFSEDKE